MSETENKINDIDDEISLLDLAAVLLKYKLLIILITFGGMAAAIVISVISLKQEPEHSILPNMYTSSANMLINDSKSPGSSLSSALSKSGLSGLADLAGISSKSGATYSALAVYLASSNPLFDAIVDNFNVLSKPIFKKSKFPKSDSRKYLEKKFKAEIDKDSGVFTLSFTDIDPIFAQSVVNFAVDWLERRFDELGIDKNKIQKENLEKNIALNYEEIRKLERELNTVANSVDFGGNAWNLPSISLTTTKLQLELEAQQQVYKQLKTQYELLKIEMQSETPVFQIIERPEAPDKKSRPSRGQLCIIVTFAALFLSVFIAFLLNSLANIRNDAEAMEKLFPHKKHSL